MKAAFLAVLLAQSSLLPAKKPAADKKPASQAAQAAGVKGAAGQTAATTPKPGPGHIPSDAMRDISSRITLDTSEAIFSTLTAMNACGFDTDLNYSDPIRAQVRAAVEKNLEGGSVGARDAMCRYMRDKQMPDASRELAQYVSLAINLSDPPFSLTTKEADLPPDALNLAGFIPLLQNFYNAAGLEKIWKGLHAAYEAQLDRIHGPIAEMIFRTDLYLKLPFSGYLGRKFVVYVDPMGASGQVNARNYSSDYFLVVSPGTGPVKIDQIRHTYLHYVMDPLAAKRANTIRKIVPLLDTVATAPLDDSYKRDAALMVIESLIRAVEARTLPVNDRVAKNVEAARSRMAQAAMEQGFILTRYFYDKLAEFEKDPVGLRDAFPQMLSEIDLGAEKKRASQITFSEKASPDLVTASNSRRPGMLDLAEGKIAQGDAQGAHNIAQKVLDEKTAGEDPARAMFILARAATMTKDMDGARLMFERTLEVSKEPRTLAWSHILLGRILDLMCNRDAAVTHYRAALGAGDTAADTKTAAEKGINVLPPGCEEKSE